MRDHRLSIVAFVLALSVGLGSPYARTVSTSSAPAMATPTTAASVSLRCAPGHLRFDGACRSEAWIETNLLHSTTLGGIAYGAVTTSQDDSRILIIEQVSDTLTEMVLLSTDQPTSSRTSRAGYKIEEMYRGNVDVSDSSHPKLTFSLLSPSFLGRMAIEAQESYQLIDFTTGGCSSTEWEHCSLGEGCDTYMGVGVCYSGSVDACDAAVNSELASIEYKCKVWTAVGGVATGSVLIGGTVLSLGAATPELVAAALAMGGGVSGFGYAACGSYAASFEYQVRSAMDCFADADGGCDEPNDGHPVDVETDDGVGEGGEGLSGFPCSGTFSVEDYSYDQDSGMCCGTYIIYECDGTFNDDGDCEADIFDCSVDDSYRDCSPDISESECEALN